MQTSDFGGILLFHYQTNKSVARNNFVWKIGMSFPGCHSNCLRRQNPSHRGRGQQTIKSTPTCARRQVKWNFKTFCLRFLTGTWFEVSTDTNIFSFLLFDSVTIRRPVVLLANKRQLIRQNLQPETILKKKKKEEEERKEKKKTGMSNLKMLLKSQMLKSFKEHRTS